MTPQQKHFERRLSDLRAFREAERFAADEGCRLVNGPYTPEEYAASEAAYDVVRGAVKMAAEELAVVYYEF